jgi:hypothetical protein
MYVAYEITKQLSGNRFNIFFLLAGWSNFLHTIHQDFFGKYHKPKIQGLTIL